MILSLSYNIQQIIVIKKSKKQNQNKKYKCNSERMEQDARGKNQNITFIANNLVEGPQQLNCNCKTKTIL